MTPLRKPLDVEEVKRLYGEGWGLYKLGQHTGTSASTIRRRLCEEGVTLRVSSWALNLPESHARSVATQAARQPVRVPLDPGEYPPAPTTPLALSIIRGVFEHPEMTRPELAALTGASYNYVCGVVLRAGLDVPRKPGSGQAGSRPSR